MRRRPSTPSVTLFPFLAVLVCTMGALIFLLLVTTQKIQKQSRLPLASLPVEPFLDQQFVPSAPVEFPIAEEPFNPQSLTAMPPVDGSLHVEASQMEAPQIAELPLLPVAKHKLELDENEPILPLLAGNSAEDHAWLQAEWEATQHARRQEYETALARRNREQTELEQKWAQKFTGLQQESTTLASHLQELSQRRQRLQAEIDVLIADKKLAVDRLQKLQSQLSQAQEISQFEQNERLRLLNMAADLTKQIARLESEQEQTIPHTEIVAYDSITGTSRKPILIECRQSEIVFASEGIVLSAKELSGFPPEYNPLKAGAEALLDYWSKHGEPHERPYILLVVRPAGITGFYVARGLLSEMDHHFGYELIHQDLPIRWPASDPAAMQACQEAVFNVLSERDRVAARTGRLAAAMGGPLSYTNAAGEFQLPDTEGVNRAGTNGSGSRNFLGDEKWISPKNRAQTYDNGQKNTSPAGTPNLIARPSPSRAAVSDQNSFRPHSPNSIDSGPEIMPLPTVQENPFETTPGTSLANQILQAQPQQPHFSQSSPLPGNNQQQLNSETERSSSSPGNSSARQAQQNLFQNSGAPSNSNPSTEQPRSTFPTEAANPFELTPQRKHSAQGENGTQEVRLPQKSGTIGIERETEIHLWQNQFRIDDGIVLSFPSDSNPADLKEAVTTVLANARSNWKEPPQAYFWKPVVKIVIHPGGLAHYAKIKEMVDQWKIPSSIEYELQ